MSGTSITNQVEKVSKYECRPMFCPNQKVCQAGELQKRVLACHGGLCMNCAIMLWPLVFANNVECPICLETIEGVQQANCEHFVCIDCFRRCQYGDESRQGEPPFPYPKEIEEKYGNEEELGEEVDWEVIEKWNADWIRWDDEKRKNIYYRVPFVEDKSYKSVTYFFISSRAHCTSLMERNSAAQRNINPQFLARWSVFSVFIG